MKTISLLGWYGRQNFGDDSAMLVEITKFFNRLGYEIKVHNDNDFNYNDVVVIGGGGVVAENFWPLKDISKLRGKKVIVFNVNVTHETDKVIDRLKELNAFWVVRDQFSMNYLKSNNITNALYSPDICFSSFGGLNKPKGKILAVNCNYFIFKDIFSDEYHRRLRAENAYFALQKFLLWMMHFSWKIRFVPLQTNELIDDRVTNSYLYGLLGCKYENILDDNVLENISDCSFIVGSRFHLAVYALANKLPIINVNFHSKSSNLFNDIQLPECSLDYYSLTPELLINTAITVENNPDFSDKVDSYSVMNVTAWNDVAQQIQHLLI